MTQTHTVQFIHRLNDDGTIDSICRDCFVTIATEESASSFLSAKSETTYATHG